MDFEEDDVSTSLGVGRVDANAHSGRSDCAIGRGQSKAHGDYEHTLFWST